MKKLSTIVMITLATAGQAFAGGLNQAATDAVIDEPIGAPVGSGGGGLLIAAVVLGALAAAASSANGTTSP